MMYNKKLRGNGGGIAANLHLTENFPSDLAVLNIAGSLETDL